MVVQLYSQLPYFINMNNEIKEINHLEETNCCAITSLQKMISYRQRLHDLITEETKPQTETGESLLSTTSLNILLRD